MPQAWLPLIPSGATRINDVLGVEKIDGRWFYFCGLNPVFIHAEEDRRSFRMFTSQLVYQGQCRQVEIIRAFGISRNSVSRGVQKFKEGGADAFFVTVQPVTGCLLSYNRINQSESRVVAFQFCGRSSSILEAGWV